MSSRRRTTSEMRTFAPLLAALWVAGCTQTFFQPLRALVDTPERHGIAYRELDFKADDGTPLHAWFLPGRGAAQASVLFLHGNAENISTHFHSVAWMPAEGFNVLALDYRGYGESQGTPSVAGAQLDIDAAMRTLLALPDAPERGRRRERLFRLPRDHPGEARRILPHLAVSMASLADGRRRLLACHRGRRNQPDPPAAHPRRP